MHPTPCLPTCFPCPPPPPLHKQIHQHVLIHGDLRKSQKIMVAGEEMEIETMLHMDEAEDEGVVKHSTEKLGKRASFVRMRDQ